MTMVKADDLLTQVFVLVDDWYQAYGHRLRPRLPGPRCRFSESEMLTLLVVMDYFPYPGEEQFLVYLRALGTLPSITRAMPVQSASPPSLWGVRSAQAILAQATGGD